MAQMLNNNGFILKRYTDLKPVEQESVRYKEYYALLLEYLTSRFKWTTDLESELPPNFIEMSLSIYGMVAVYIDKHNELTISPATFQGDFNKYGLCDKVICWKFNGETETHTVDKDCIVIFNNQAHLSDDFIIERYDTQLSQCDISQVYNLYYSRYSRMFRTNNEKDKIQLINAFKSMKIGEPIITVSNSVGCNDFLDSAEPFTPIEITDVNQSDKIQYLSRYHDDLINRFLNTIGIASTNINKSAQVSVEEIEKQVCASRIVLQNKLEMRQRAVKNINSLFCTNWSVELNDELKKQTDTEQNTKEEKETESSESNDNERSEE